MRLDSVFSLPRAARILYELLAERPAENFISHEKMPTMDEHEDFVASNPFRYWYLVYAEGVYVGALECTELNEIGVAIFKRFRRKGYGAQALKLFIETHKPLPAIPARRNGRWLANIATHNIGSKLFFANAGFRPIQETWQL